MELWRLVLPAESLEQVWPCLGGLGGAALLLASPSLSFCDEPALARSIWLLALTTRYGSEHLGLTPGWQP